MVYLTSALGYLIDGFTSALPKLNSKLFLYLLNAILVDDNNILSYALTVNFEIILNSSPCYSFSICQQLLAFSTYLQNPATSHYLNYHCPCLNSHYPCFYTWITEVASNRSSCIYLCPRQSIFNRVTRVFLL